jgi:hypothetical protein
LQITVHGLGSRRFNKRILGTVECVHCHLQAPR